MKKIHFYLILVYSINFYANDSITAVSIKNINLREQATTNSKILSDVKADDTLKIISKENEWSNVIYKDSLNGYVKSEFIKGIKNVKAEILKLEVMKKLFFKVLFLISILCFGLLYLLKKKLMQFEINGKASLIAKSIILSFIITVMATAYFFYDLLSFFKIFGIIILLLFLIYKTYNIFFYEKLIKLNKDFFIDEEQGQNITIVNNNYIDEIIGNEKLNLERIKNNLDEIKSHIRRILENEYSYNEVISLVLGVWTC